MSIPTGRAFAKALEEAGVISDLNSITRVVIDINGIDAVRVYVERIGDNRLLDAFKGPLGMMLAENAPEAETQCCDLHGRDCEPPDELCCELCTEARHAGWVDGDLKQRRGHLAGEVCSNPDLGGAI